jgi:hypothetical protein
MHAHDYQRFVGYYEQGKLLPPRLPGRALACLALFAPHAGVGSFYPGMKNACSPPVEEHT